MSDLSSILTGVFIILLDRSDSLYSITLLTVACGNNSSF